MGFYIDAVFVNRVVDSASGQHAGVCKKLVDALSNKHGAANKLEVHRLRSKVMNLSPSPDP